MSGDYETLAQMPKIMSAMTELRLRKKLMASKDYEALKSTALLCEESLPIIEAISKLMPAMLAAETLADDNRKDVVSSTMSVINDVIEKQRKTLEDETLKDQVS